MTVVVRRGPLAGGFLIAGCGKEGPVYGRIPYLSYAKILAQ